MGLSTINSQHETDRNLSVDRTLSTLALSLLVLLICRDCGVALAAVHGAFSTRVLTAVVSPQN